MFALGSEHCTAYDTWKHDMDLPIILHKRKRETRKFREATTQQDQWAAPARANNKRDRPKW